MVDDPKKQKGGPLVQTSIEDVLGAGKITERILEALKVGIGPVLEPWWRARMAKADQAAVVGYVEAIRKSGLRIQELDVTTAAGRADIRIHAERAKRQANRESVALHAMREIPPLTQDHATVREDADPIDPEWLDRFWRLAQDITADDLQSLWGRLLARQAVGASRIGARTLDTLSLLDRDDIGLLTRLAPVTVSAIPGASFWLFAFSLENKIDADRLAVINDKIALYFEGLNYHHTNTIGITTGTALEHHLEFPRGSLTIAIGAHFYDLKDRGYRMIARIGSGLGLSQSGREIVSLITTEPNANFAQLIKQGCDILRISLERSR